LRSDFIKPRYGSGGFSSIPGRVVEAFDDSDLVLLFLVDAFGWRLFERFADTPFLRRFSRDGGGAGKAERLVTQFPSTTTACMTSLHTGLSVGRHGLLEWNYYESRLDAMISPILFSFAGDKERDGLARAGVDARDIFPSDSFYERLAALGIASHVFQLRDYTPSTYSNHMLRGARVRPFTTLPEAIAGLAASARGMEGKNYVLVYWDRVDSIGHRYGPDSPQIEAEILSFLLTMEEIALPLLSSSGRRMRIFLGADHGLCSTPPEETLYLNEDPRFAGLPSSLKRDGKGRALVAAGSCRDFFLYCKDAEARDEARGVLAAGLEDLAEVALVEELAAEGYFGPDPGPELRSRAGDLVILPLAGRSVWWREKGRFEQGLRGHHGGLSQEEMLVPFLTLDL
jgi:hypothetical protein